MYTYDEWGNIVFHIQTGRAGIEMFKEMGIENTITPEEYKKHMDSYRRIQQKRLDAVMIAIKEFLDS